MPRKRVLFLQLPQLDNDVPGRSENVPLAATYLSHAVLSSPETRHFEVLPHPAGTDRLNDHALADDIAAIKPDILAGTLYLWNIERFLAVAGLLKKRIPGLAVFVGGPEVSRGHPFLLNSPLIDAAATGEGEPVMPLMLRAWRLGKNPDLAAVAWRTPRGLKWGRKHVPSCDLSDLLPPADAPFNKPDAAGMAYMETSRGCPMRCAFCCYNQRRSTMSFMKPDDALRRIKVLQKRGAKEIRFIDPTFNSHPLFDEMLRGIARLNRAGKLAFFAEIRADTLTEAQADLLKAANFTDLEIGVQSRDPAVARLISRPMAPAALDRGIGFLAQRKRHLTLDIMCGLPGQTTEDIEASLKWAHGVPRATVQFLHTLLLPGTSLRDNSRRLGLEAQDRPPYRVLKTRSLTAKAILDAEQTSRKLARLAPDSPAARFAGRILPDLFPERIPVPLDEFVLDLPGRQNRTALLFSGSDLYANRKRIQNWISRAIEEEPRTLWQFVLAPENEEPLDLLDDLVLAIRNARPHWLDRLNPDPECRLVARRIFVQIPRSGLCRESWTAAAEGLLSAAFY